MTHFFDIVEIDAITDIYLDKTLKKTMSSMLTVGLTISEKKNITEGA